jgi:hypothetical protein
MAQRRMDKSCHDNLVPLKPSSLDAYVIAIHRRFEYRGLYYLAN